MPLRPDFDLVEQNLCVNCLLDNRHDASFRKDVEDQLRSEETRECKVEWSTSKSENGERSLY